jgi:hypothetical protein
LFRTVPSIADLDPDRVEENQRVKRLQRPVLPFVPLLQDGVGDGADRIRRNIEPIELTPVPLDLAGAHPTGVHCTDLLIDARKAPLILGDQRRIEGRQPVAGDLEGDLAGVGQHRLRAVAVAAVGAPLSRAQVMIHLRVQPPLGQRLLQLIERAVLLERGLRIPASRQLVERGIGNDRRFASGHAMSPLFPSSWPLHEIMGWPAPAPPSAIIAGRSQKNRRVQR